MKSHVLAITTMSVITVSGCSSMQPSTYESVATAEKTTITATGSAAEAAARSTTVGACHTCNANAEPATSTTPRQRQAGRPPSRYERAADRVHSRAVNTAAMQVSIRVDEALKEIFRFGQ